MVNMGLLEMRQLNMQEARKWITRAAEKGHHQANVLLDELNLRDTPMDPTVYYYNSDE